ncbi:MAG: replicative DNA helicase [Ruminococcaceae bacterium]|nr:replicative DNA helicase [Oscillospiraceae bacterium]
MDDLQRKLPYSQFAEQAVLGCVFIDPESFADLATRLSDEDFYLPEHRAVFAAMKQMFNESKRIDVVTLINRLSESGACDKAGGVKYIKLLAESVPTASNVKDYAQIVHDKAVLRRLIGVCGEISDTAFSEEGKVSDIVGSAEQKIYDIANNKSGEDFKNIGDVVMNVVDHLVDLSSDKAGEKGLQTGYSALDKVLIGMGPGDMVLVGARPGMGKTSFTLNIAANVAKSSGKAVCIFSLEMTAEQLVMRMISSEGMVSNNSMRTGKISQEEWDKLTFATEKLSACDIRIDDTAGITISQMRAKLRRVKGNELGLIVIDYLQLMQGDKKYDSRTNEVSDISRNLKLMAKDFGVPILCCAQLSRNPESRKNSEGGHRPMLSDLRESGSIEQDADMVMLLYSDEYYELSKEERNTTRLFEVIVAKNRHGETRTVKMGWVPQYTKFVTLMPEDEEKLMQARQEKS